MKKLQVLNIYRNQISDISCLERMKDLREAYVGENPLRDLSVLFELDNLLVARVEGTSVGEPQRKHLEDHINKNRARRGLEPTRVR